MGLLDGGLDSLGSCRVDVLPEGRRREEGIERTGEKRGG